MNSRVMLLSGAWLLFAACAPADVLPPNDHLARQARVIVLATDVLPESSGAVVSRRHVDILWTHNDSGSSGPRVFAVPIGPEQMASGEARPVGFIELAGASNRDWEDISAGPGNTLYVFDGGDNPPCYRTDKCIHRCREPVDLSQLSNGLHVAYESIRFDYPDPASPEQPARENDQRYDAECLMVHPDSGDIYIVTKVDTQGKGTARVFKLPADRIRWNASAVHVLEYVGDLTAAIGVTDSVLSTVTAGDIAPDGRQMLVRRYGFAYEFALPAGEPFEAIFKQSPNAIPLPGEAQGEAIAYLPDLEHFCTTSEVVRLRGLLVGPQRCPIFVRPLTTRPAE